MSTSMEGSASVIMRARGDIGQAIANPGAMIVSEG